MKITIFLLLFGICNIFAESSYSQNTRISLSLKNGTLKQVFEEIQKQSEFIFFYKDDQVELNQNLNIDADSATVEEILDQALANTNLDYKVFDRQIVVLQREKSRVPDENTKAELKEQPQNKVISGKVTDSSNASLPGVSVLVKGTTTGTITDAEGQFILSVPVDTKIVVFSFIGMKTQEIDISGKTIFVVKMEIDNVDIGEVVAVGYGTMKKRDIIGSISTIKSDVFETTSGSTNFNSLIQGQAAGVSVQNSSGRLGATVDIKIRGLSSISAGTDPLWIIDGVPVHSGITIDNNASAAQSPMQLINQSDIASIQVLKDAAATSIYGSRGSNGVIIVTTKSGGAGKSSINVDYTTGISDLPLQRKHFLNTTQWLSLKEEAKQAVGGVAFTMNDYYSQRPYSTEKLTLEQAKTINTDWRKEAMQMGNFQSVNLSANGGDKLARYYISGNYRKDNSVMKNEDLERYGIRANLDFKPTSSLDIGTKINLSSSKGNRGKNENWAAVDGNKYGNSGGFSFVNSATVPFDPVYSLINPLKYYNPYSGNPAATSDPDNLKEELQTYRVLASVYGEYAIPFLKGLSLRSELSMDLLQANRNFWVSSEVRKLGSLGQDNASTTRTVNYNLFLKYNKSVGDHSIDLTGGTESQRDNTWYRKMEGMNLLGTYQELGTPSLMTYMYSRMEGEGYIKSYFGRANYKLKDKYLAGISIRRDGSSVFTPDYRWGNFIALSAGWIFSEESFMGEFGKNHFLKLRGSFGQTGNASIPSNLDVSNYSAVSNLSELNYAYGSAAIFGNNGTNLTSIGVSDLSWESTNNMDLGLDFGFFNHRIDGSLAYYNKYVTGLLLASTLPLSAGIGSIWGNIGDLVNSGIEVSVTTSNLITGNLKWQTTVNVAFNHNEVKKLTPEVDEAGTGMVDNIFITKVGYGIRDFYLADWAGVDPKTGLGMIYALDKDFQAATGETQHLKNTEGRDSLLIANNANCNDNYFHIKGKNTMPTYYGGITNKFTYKAFDLSVFVMFSGGNYILDNFMRNIIDPNGSGEILTDILDNYWKKPGDIAKYQRLNWKANILLEDGTNVRMGDPRTNRSQFLFKGDYIKLKSVNVGYTLPNTSEGKKPFQALRVYASVENLYTLTDYPGWDPEGLGDVGQWDLPQLFSASIGVTVKF